MLGFGALIACALALAIAPSPARASLVLLQPEPSVPATFVGNGGYSSDGLGQDTTGGTVQAEVPPGSTVAQAYLYGTYNGNTAPSEADRTIDFDGTDVVLQTLPNSEPGNSELSTARAEVTSLVAAKVGGGGGITDFAINSDPPDLDGVALVVIFSNPALPETTIAVLDGGSKPEGDQTTFNFDGPIDPTEPGFLATMALGIGFSFQGPSGDACGLGQFSTVEVNSQLLTGCAGNYDDGLPANGALITVGGVGDSLDNPTPPDDPPTDDELYDLQPFLTTGDTQLVIQTTNPSTDDNLFLSVIATTAEARVTTEVCDNGIDDDGDGLIDGDDPDCQDPPPGEEICDNGIDDDGDGLIDGDDPDCQEPPPPGGKCHGADVTIAGTEGPDVITGTPGPDVIDAKGGDDDISGLGGNDVICAGDGDDEVAAGPGNDLVLGQGGNDEIGGGGGVDRLAGGPGDDVISGGLDNDRVNGGIGNDDLGGGPGADRVAGGAGNDDAGGGIGADQVTGGAGDDNVNGGNGNDDVGGGTGNDVIGGDAGNDRLSGGGGDDTLRGAEGDDRLGGGTGNDDLGGGPGNDDLAGGPGADDLKGGQGNDDLHGGPGSDTCDGGTGENALTSCESQATRRR